jgi:phage gp45-like
MSGSLEARVAALERHIDRLERRMRLSAGVSFARTTLPPKDTGAIQTVQSQLDPLSVRNDLPVLFHYGFSSAMPVGGDKLVVHGYGERSSAIAVATGHQQYRFKSLNTGEVVLHDMWGNSIRLTQHEIVVTGTLHVIGDIKATGGVIAGLSTGDQVTLQQHRHGLGTAVAGTSVPSPGT